MRIGAYSGDTVEHALVMACARRGHACFCHAHAVNAYQLIRLWLSVKHELLHYNVSLYGA